MKKTPVRKIPTEYFKNRQEQAKIKLALTEAIPVGVYYHNLIIALTEMLERAVTTTYEEEVFHKWDKEE